MKRVIKFRGKCSISNEWVYGDLIHGVGWKKGNVYILPDQTNLAYVKHCDPLDGVMVIPETVGQYIGLNDRNGNEIYEGDDTENGYTIMWSKDKALFCEHFYLSFKEKFSEASYPIDVERIVLTTSPAQEG